MPPNLADVFPMPSSEAILDVATAIANNWRWLAVAWHIAFVIAAISGPQMSRRAAGFLLTLPMISVSLMAWNAGNPFNGLVFLVLSALMAGLATTLGPTPLSIDSALRNITSGGLLVDFGLVYPHFLISSSWLSYVYAAPFGLLPCPTLAVVTGVSLICGSFGSRSWAMVVSVAALSYGLIGVAALRVWIDAFLIAGGLLLLATCFPMKARRIAHRVA